MNIKRKKLHLLLGYSICFSVLAALTGCKGSDDLTVFQENVRQFYTEVSLIESSLEEIDELKEDSPAEIQVCLEQLAAQFDSLAALDVPENFSGVEQLAEDAADYMSEAVRLHEEAYEGESVDDGRMEAAVQNYESAMKRIQYISLLLQGKDISQENA